MTPIPRLVSRCIAFLHRTIARSAATHTAANKHTDTDTDTDTDKKAEMVRMESGRINLTQIFKIKWTEKD